MSGGAQVAALVESEIGCHQRVDAGREPVEGCVQIGDGDADVSAPAPCTPVAVACPAECPETEPPDVASNTTLQGNDLLPYIVFFSIVFGALVSYWFSALTARSVCEAVDTMVLKIARLFFESKGTLLWQNRVLPVASKSPR